MKRFQIRPKPSQVMKLKLDFGSGVLGTVFPGVVKIDDFFRGGHKYPTRFEESKKSQLMIINGTSFGLFFFSGW